MKVSKLTIINFLHRVAEPFAPKSEADRRSKIRATFVVLAVIAIIYYRLIRHWVR